MIVQCALLKYQWHEYRVTKDITSNEQLLNSTLATDLHCSAVTMTIHFRSFKVAEKKLMGVLHHTELYSWATRQNYASRHLGLSQWQSNLFCDEDTCSSLSESTTSLIGRLPQDVDGRSWVESALAMCTHQLTETCNRILFHSRRLQAYTIIKKTFNSKRVN